MSQSQGIKGGTADEAFQGKTSFCLWNITFNNFYMHKNAYKKPRQAH